MSTSTADLLRLRARRVFALISTGDLTEVEALIAPDYVDHRGGPPGRDGFVLGLGMIRAAFPDWTSTPDDLVVEGDRVGARWTVRGTHLGDFFGVPASGRAVVMQEAGILRFHEGRLVELWRVADELALLRQLGALPPALEPRKTGLQEELPPGPLPGAPGRGGEKRSLEDGLPRAEGPLTGAPAAPAAE